MIQGHGGVLDRFDSYLLRRRHVLRDAASAWESCRFRSDAMRKRVAILGSTGSIGTQALDVIARHPDAFEVVGLAAGRNVELLARTSAAFRRRRSRRTAADGPAGLHARRGRERTRTIVLAATDGSVAFDAVFAAVERGIDVAVANKELVVAAGDAARRSGRAQRCRGCCRSTASIARSFSVLVGEERSSVAAIVLTASGGPFWRTPREEMERADLAAALAHPTWRMGTKNTIDSATMMNKGSRGHRGEPAVRLRGRARADRRASAVGRARLRRLHRRQREVAARRARHAAADRLRPGYPERLARSTDCRSPESTCCEMLGAKPDEAALRYDFEAPDPDRFPCVRLAYEALAAGGALPAVLSAANEVAVDAFVEGRIAFRRDRRGHRGSDGPGATRRADARRGTSGRSGGSTNRRRDRRSHRKAVESLILHSRRHPRRIREDRHVPRDALGSDRAARARPLRAGAAQRRARQRVCGRLGPQARRLDQPAQRHAVLAARAARSAATARWRARTAGLRGRAAARVLSRGAQVRRATFRPNRRGGGSRSSWPGRSRTSSSATRSCLVGALAFGVAERQGDQPVVGEVVAGSPAAIAGIRPGDRIVAIDDVPITIGQDVSSTRFTLARQDGSTSSTCATASRHEVYVTTDALSARKSGRSFGCIGFSAGAGLRARRLRRARCGRAAWSSPRSPIKRSAASCLLVTQFTKYAPADFRAHRHGTGRGDGAGLGLGPVLLAGGDDLVCARALQSACRFRRSTAAAPRSSSPSCFAASRSIPKRKRWFTSPALRR